MGNGFSGTRDVGLPPFARAFARRGIAAFAFDYRCFGASLGGGLVVVIGAEDEGVSAIVAQVPALDSDVEPSGLELSVSWGLRLLFTGWADLLWSLFSPEALLIPAFAPPGEHGMLIDDESFADLEPLRVPGSLWRNEIAARSFMTFDDYNPAGSWDGIDVPVLVLATEQDRLAPFEAVRAFAAARPQVRVETFEGDHFDVYQPPVSDTAAALQADFLIGIWRQVRPVRKD